MLDFEGTQPPAALLALLSETPIGGVTLYRARNIETPDQTRALTSALQRAARQSGRPPLLIAADQEGGQLMAVGDPATGFPGNMALGAARSTSLARQVGWATGRELASMGININYAPVCDVLTNPRSASIGVRSFGEDPAQVAALAAAVAEGIQSAGVAAAAKHFPGHGDADADPHYETPVVPHDRRRLGQVELPPFAAAVSVGVRLIMTTHAAYPALTAGNPLPATLSRAILHDLLRAKMGYQGLIITDALNMGAIRQGMEQVIDVLAATLAGADLLLLGSDKAVRQAVFSGLAQAVQRGIIAEADIRASAGRVLDLKAWMGRQTAPALDVVGCADHRAIAAQVAERSVTLVRDHARLLPLRPGPDARIAVIVPQPQDLTPADTSSRVRHTLAESIRHFHPAVDEIITSHAPDASEIDALRQRAAAFDLLIVGTLAAHMQPAQAVLVRALLDTGTPTVTVALRTPYDLLAYPEAPTYVCSYSLLEPSMRAVARALWGEIPFAGRLPVSLGDLYPLGHGVDLPAAH